MRYLIVVVFVLVFAGSATADSLDQAFQDFTSGKYKAALPVLEAAADDNPQAAFAAGMANFRLARQLRRRGMEADDLIQAAYRNLETADHNGYRGANWALFELNFRERERAAKTAEARDAANEKSRTEMDKLSAQGRGPQSVYESIVLLRTPAYIGGSLDSTGADFLANKATEEAEGVLADWYKAEALTEWAHYQWQQVKGLNAYHEPYNVYPLKERAYFAYKRAVELTGSIEAQDRLALLTADGWDPLVPQDHNTAMAQPVIDPSGPAAEGLRAFDLGNYLSARKLLKDAADEGNPDAAFAMYYMIDNGLGRSSRDQDGGYDRRNEVANDYLSTALVGNSPEAKIVLAERLRERAKVLLDEGRDRNDKEVRDLVDASYAYLEEGWNSDLPYAARVRVKLTYGEDPIYGERLLRYYNFYGKSTFMRWDRAQNLSQLALHIADGNGTGKYGFEFERLNLQMAMGRMKRAVANSRNPDAYGYQGLLVSGLSDDPADKVEALNYFLEGAKAGDRLSHQHAIETLFGLAPQGGVERVIQSYALSLVAGEIWPIDEADAQNLLSGLDQADAERARRYGKEKVAEWRQGKFSIFEEIQQTL